jgi:hypothetical protein
VKAGSSEQRGEPGRHEPAETFREIVQPAAPEDERAASLWLDTLQWHLRADPETQLGAEPDAPRFDGQKRIGTTLDDEAVDALGHDLAPKTLVRFDERDPQPGQRGVAQLQEAVRRGKTGDAAAKHDHMAGCRKFS